jgi:hypothetical protein
MSQQTPQNTSLFRTSLRSWQANYRARRAENAEAGEVPAAPATPQRVKKLTPYKRRKLAARRG